MTRSQTALVGVLLAVVLAGCGASNPIKQYPAFPDRYAQARGTRVLADVTVAEDVRGRADQVTLATNRAIAEAMTDSLATWLGGRGYAVDHAYPGVVGLYLGRDQRFHARADEGAEVDSAAVAPFFVDPAVQADTLLLATLDRALWPTAAPPRAWAGEPEAFVLLIVRGRRVPLGKSLAQGIISGLVSGLVTGGTAISMYEQSYVVAELYVVAAGTGELLWRDQHVAKGTAGDGTIRDAVHRLVRRLPDRGV